MSNKTKYRSTSEAVVASIADLYDIGYRVLTLTELKNMIALKLEAESFKFTKGTLVAAVHSITSDRPSAGLLERARQMPLLVRSAEFPDAYGINSNAVDQVDELIESYYAPVEDEA